jgi:serine/threonine-protein kinase
LVFWEVYRAYDRELKREVALKRVLRGSYLLPDELARFRREAELAASLQHPNIVPVLDYGESKDGPYLVMPIMVRSLAMWLKSLGPDRLLPWKDAAEKVRVLAARHSPSADAGSSRSKPGNILLDQDSRLLSRTLDWPVN